MVEYYYEWTVLIWIVLEVKLYNVSGTLELSLPKNDILSLH